MKRILTLLILLFAITATQAQLSYTAPELTYYSLQDSYAVNAPQTDMTFYQSELPIPRAQMTWWEKHRRSFAVMGIQVLSIGLEGVGDALYDMGKDAGNVSQMQWGHTLQATSVGVLVLSIPLLELKKKDAIPFTLSYLGLRFGTFDGFYNTTRGLPFFYAGTTSAHDNILSKIPPRSRAWIKGIVVVGTVSFDIKYFW